MRLDPIDPADARAAAELYGLRIWNPTDMTEPDDAALAAIMDDIATRCVLGDQRYVGELEATTAALGYHMVAKKASIVKNLGRSATSLLAAATARALVRREVHCALVAAVENTRRDPTDDEEDDRAVAEDMVLEHGVLPEEVWKWGPAQDAIIDTIREHRRTRRGLT